LSLRAKFLVGGVLFFGVLLAAMALGVMETVEIIDHRMEIIDHTMEIDRLGGFSSEKPLGELDEAIEDPPIDRTRAIEIADTFISFPYQPDVKLTRDRHDCLSWKISAAPITRIEIDARTGEVISVSDDRGLSFSQGFRGSDQNVARQVMEKIGWPKPGMDLVNPRTQSIGTAKSIYWNIEYRGIPCEGLASVMFSEEGQPVQTGHTWLIIPESSQAEPEVSVDEGISIGREKAIMLGLAHNGSNSESRLMWRRPGDIDAFGYKCKLTWETIHSNPYPRQKGIPSLVYVYVDALTGDVIGIDFTMG
jgi:hypothetical protein